MGFLICAITSRMMLTSLISVGWTGFHLVPIKNLHHHYNTKKEACVVAGSFIQGNSTYFLTWSLNKSIPTDPPKKEKTLLLGVFLPL
jgi:hypothetical protein